MRTFKSILVIVALLVASAGASRSGASPSPFGANKPWRDLVTCFENLEWCDVEHTFERALGENLDREQTKRAVAYVEEVQAQQQAQRIEAIATSDLSHPCDDAIELIVRREFARWGEQDWAVDTAWDESRCRADVFNWNGGQRDSGVMQMRLPLHHDKFEDVGCSADDWADPFCNVRAGARLYELCGRAPWTKPSYGCRPPGE